jgi:UDP-N-acetylglucosamine--N-acetylmuramyl-(pentapeptide) pyrophosphoryl-undecaprenol N-acetylglucosamine transferase
VTGAGRATRVAIAGGGTGGHVFPALALAEELSRGDDPCELLFVGSAGGLEEKLVPPAGHRLVLLRVGRLKGADARSRLRTLSSLPAAVLRAASHLADFSPDAVVGVGGFASGPVVIAAALARRPIVLLEQNSIPGVTNRVLSRLADRVVVAFERSARYLPRGRAVLLGNPVRRDFLEARALKEAGRGGGGAGRRLLVLGGSQGARALNELATRALPEVAARLAASGIGLEVVHQSGAADAAWVEASYREAGLAAEVHPFISEMAPALSRADLVLGRAGATTIAELSVVGVPAFFVPYPFAADDHQAENAATLARSGCALWERQGALNPGGIAATLSELLADGGRLDEMAEKMRAAALPDAARDAAALVRRVAERRRGAR